MSWHWTLVDADGTALRDSETFDDKAAAEAWMGRAWGSLASEGAASVRLVEDGRLEYEMSLAPE